MKIMNTIWKKIIVLGILTLFLTMSLAPSISAERKEKEKTNNQLNSVKEVYREEKQVITASHTTLDEVTDLQILLADLTAEQRSFDNIKELINWFVNQSDSTLISYLISQLMDTQRLTEREIILSFGWNIDINPLKKDQFKIMKPLLLWKFMDGSDLMNIPSTTVLISKDPVTVERIVGNQIGFMYRFRGIYGHVTNQLPEKSFTYMIGSAKGVTAIELPNMNLF